jgi:transcriptional regulator with XRE-family HTH domain
MGGIRMTDNELIICERFKKIRKFLDMKQIDFANAIKLTQGHVSDIENKRKCVSDRIVEIICLKYNINEEWLRNGTEPMFNIKTDDFTEISVEIDKHDAKARQAIIDYWNLSEDDKRLFWAFLDKFVKSNGEG